MSTPSDPPWYRPRGYAHFDRKPHREQVLAYVQDPARVASHGFFPFILRPVRVVHFKSEKDGTRRRKAKVRPIAFAAHMDTHIHAYYGHQLAQALEQLYTTAPFGDSVVAYRRLGKCNIDFALSAIREVQALGEADVLAFDVEGFFDTLDHSILKRAWACLLGVGRLPDDHFAVYRSVTRDTAVLWPKLRLALRDRQRRRTGRTGAPVCSLDAFHSVIKPLIQRRHELIWKIKGKAPPAHIPAGAPVGIPQGSAMSAALANVYMFAFDEQLFERLHKLGATYRRYSDDILVIAPRGVGPAAEVIVREVLDAARLAINDDKTERVVFRRGSDGSIGVDPSGGNAPALRYLGLSFDGQHVRLRDSTIARYLIRMHRAVDRARYSAEEQEESAIRRRKLYATMSRLGPGRAYGRWVELENGRWEPPPSAPRLGFLGYSQRAARAADDQAAHAQNERLWEQLHITLRNAEKKL